MPRSGPDGPGTRRPYVAFKLDPAQPAAIAQRALSEGLTIRNGEPNRSEMGRLLIAYALENMPKGWRPK
jgi:hypothetical protein